ncbi:RICIN domain-containing protein [Amycolatopsis sp. NPDC005232]|uniref:RICIN domain-containing protein n=1 Tax=Amycolatopsis sp. NPDC005232 TaxID=3157027 RepID=UPI0033ABB65D
MIVKKLAAVCAAAVLALGLSAAPASATAVEWTWRNQATDHCLDFRADVGPYATDCNNGNYQLWIMTPGDDPTAMRQVATRLCLTVRNTVLTMKPCLAADQAALWRPVPTTGPFYQLVSYVNPLNCVGEGPDRRVKLVTCTGGPSQQWQ